MEEGHKHEVKHEGDDCAYTGKVPNAEAAGGNVERLQICVCGATRWVAINQRHRAYGEWEKWVPREVVVRHRSTIPNRAGYRVRLLLVSGKWIDDMVTVGPDRLHRLSRTVITQVVGWLPS